VDDEKQLLQDGRYIEALLITSLHIENHLKTLYFYKKGMTLYKQWYNLQEMMFYKILDNCLSEGYISNQAFKQIKRLKDARNEIARTPLAHNRYIDSNKCKKILEPCLKILNRTHNQLVKLEKLRKNPLL